MKDLPASSVVSPAPLAVVALGASAGGLEALQQFFDQARSVGGIAYVVIQHLSPDFPSMMHETLARHTQLPILRVEEGMPLQAGAIHLMPPGKMMTLTAGNLHLVDKLPAPTVTFPIDCFFESMATAVGIRPVAVVLSGTGNDGSTGILRVKEAGGLVIVQDPATSRFDGMPDSAIATGIADAVLAPTAMPDAIIELLGKPGTGGQLRAPTSASVEKRIFRLLEQHFQIDFSGYKPSTILRRIERRQSFRDVTSMDDYLDCLAIDGEELRALYKDFMIGVTEFFRDASAFEALEQLVIPQLVSRLGEADPVRIWVPACAGGEEPYSIAMLLHEAAAKSGVPLNAKIFATDADHESIMGAREGVYSAAAMAGISDERRERYFVEESGAFRVVPDIRKVIVFARHNLIKDPPFTRLDMISCRNLLIYFTPELQKRVMALFHFALRKGGHLFLGMSESIESAETEFTPVDRKAKIFVKREGGAHGQENKLRLPVVVREEGGGEPGAQRNAILTASMNRSRILRAYDALHARYVPNSILINRTGAVLHVFGDMEGLLKPLAGRVTYDLLDMVDEELRIPLGDAIKQAGQEARPVAFRNVHRSAVHAPNQQVNLIVEPLKPGENGVEFLLVIFESKEAVERSADGVEFDLSAATQNRISDLESQLQFTREHLQSTIEELETSNEELQSANEEMMAANEELQSTNEELHSINEELHSLNAEHKAKIQELGVLTVDMDNLLRSTEIATIFVDRQLKIRKFTPAISCIFNLISQDVGRPIEHITTKLPGWDILAKMRRVMESAEQHQEEVCTADSTWYLMRILPYRTAASAVAGVVLTFTNINPLKQAEQATRESWSFLQATVNALTPHVAVLDDQGMIVMVNEAWRLFAANNDGDIERCGVGSSYLEACVGNPGDDQMTGLEIQQSLKDLLGGALTTMHYAYPCHSAGEQRWFEMVAISFSFNNRSWVVVTHDNVTERRKAEEERDRIAAQIQQQQKLESIRLMVSGISHDFNNIIAAIMANAELSLMEEGVAPEGNLARQLTQIRAGAGRASDLVKQLLAYAGRNEVNKQPISMNEAVRETTHLVRVTVPRTTVIELALDESIPLVSGDLTQLEQIILNLVKNAAEAIGDHGGIITLATGQTDCSADFRIGAITPGVCHDGRHAWLAVRDTGPGIPTADLYKIFDPFFSTKFTGRGLGLASVLAIVRAHEGFIRVVPSPGSGTGAGFEIFLPALDAAVAVTVNPLRKGSASSTARYTGRVLLADDEPALRTVTETMLKRIGFQITACADGKQALAEWKNRAEGPEIVLALLDETMPGVSGTEVIEEIRRKVGPLLPIILMSGLPPAGRIAKLTAQGRFCFLPKPFSMRQLDAAVAEVMCEPPPASQPPTAVSTQPS